MTRSLFLRIPTLPPPRKLVSLCRARLAVFMTLLLLLPIACKSRTQSDGHADIAQQQDQRLSADGNGLTEIEPGTELTSRSLGKGLMSADGSYFVVYSVSPHPLPLNESFSLDVKVLDGATRSKLQSDVTLDVDGRMPHHRHGMNRQPRITRKGEGVFRVDGMLFHMPGRWELYFDVSRNGSTERAQDVIMLD